MRKTTIATLVVAMMAIAGPAVAGPGNPQDTGCPAGMELISVSDLLADGYNLPASVDDAGNNDGYVCGRALGDGTLNSYPDDIPVDTIYNFSDNTYFSN
ncbi:MAG: hypothetical protein ABFR53_11605 [Actinomycetota bacterium]